MKALAQVVDPGTESGATIFEYTNPGGDGEATTTTTLLVACRGSATPINFSTNLRFRLVPPEEDDAGGFGGSGNYLVHEGFRDAAAGLWELVRQELDGVRKAGRTSASRILFTGHSLGAATALLCATKYQNLVQTGSSNSNSNSDSNGDSNNLPSLEGVITFGGPRLANTALAEDWTSGLFESVVVTNFVHDLDPILRQNGPLWDSLGFGIVGTEVRCEAYEPVVYFSDSDNENDERRLPLAWNILDHCNYLGVFVGPRLF